MIKITSQQQVLDKYKNLPPKLKNALESSLNYELIEKIGQNYSLDSEDVETLRIFTGYVILGFLKPQNLLSEVNVYLIIDDKTVVDVIREINREILFPLHEELEKVYRLDAHIEKTETAPIEEVTKKLKPQEEIIILEKIGEEKTKGGSTEPIEPALAIKPRPSHEAKPGEPLILHEEKSLAEEIPRSSFRGLSLPFRIFRPKPASEQEKPVRASIETFGGTPKKDEKPEKKIVHYSEFRTALSPFETKGGGELKKEPELEKKPEIKTENPKSLQEKIQEIVAETKNEKPDFVQPRLDGNIIDLRNNHDLPR